jgi:hypothetical protein
MKSNRGHTFHIPVMGISFTIDTPLKVAQYGIDSVISLGDDMLLEKLRKMYSDKNDIPYDEIPMKVKDHRALRITSYLNLINQLAEKKIDELKNMAVETSTELKKYFDMLPDGSEIKSEFNKLKSKVLSPKEMKDWLVENLSMGSIDVNIMTKVDKENYTAQGELMPIEYNNAYAAIRGFAESDLNSSLILSAGMNPRLYGYMENFEDFYPNKNDEINKKIVLKVSDYRSALIQGKFLAKKGLWVSEYRIESGLNCGGHAFATDGFLMGPILAEFRDKRDELIQSVYEILLNAFANSDRKAPENTLPLKITAQGGVGTAEEHQFLIDHYKIDSVGWGTPFLLVPEATVVDKETLDRLVEAKEEDLYLSGVSPLGVPFNNLRGNSKDFEKLSNIEKGRPGSKCPKGYLAFNKEYSEQAYCESSRQFQRLKLKELKENCKTDEAYNKAAQKVIDKSCICVGLGTSALLKNDLDMKAEGPGVSVCPGPNMAYFSKTMTLEEITDHMYGRANVITRTDRPNMFIKELNLYIEYFKNRIEEVQETLSKKQENYLRSFSANLEEGINYYHNLFNDLKESFKDEKSRMLIELDAGLKSLELLSLEIEKRVIEFAE